MPSSREEPNTPTGPFRLGRGISESGWYYAACGSCGGLFVIHIRMIGFGSRTGSIRDRYPRNQLELQEDFQRNIGGRCRCDAVGNADVAREYNERNEKIASERRTRKTASRPTSDERLPTSVTRHVDDLAKLVELFERGVLTRDQFEAAKNKLLGIPTSTSPVHPAAWYPDPSGRYPLRYWDGTKWTAHVSSANGVAQTIDPRGAL